MPFCQRCLARTELLVCSRNRPHFRASFMISSRSIAPCYELYPFLLVCARLQSVSRTRGKVQIYLIMLLHIFGCRDETNLNLGFALQVFEMKGCWLVFLLRLWNFCNNSLKRQQNCATVVDSVAILFLLRNILIDEMNLYILSQYHPLNSCTNSE